MPTFAILDLETTGLNQFQTDRIVELAVVLMVPSVGVIDEFTTVINPERDVGPTSIHGLTATDVVSAPRFRDIVVPLVTILARATAIVGHNVRFDMSFLNSELERLGAAPPLITAIDTMRLARGGTLSACCAKYKLENKSGAHAALNDARVTAQLFDAILRQEPDALARYEPFRRGDWPHIDLPSAPPLPRHQIAEIAAAQPRYIQRIADRLPAATLVCADSDAESGYRSLLWRVLEDARIDESEGDSLLDIALCSGLTFLHVEAIHLEYLSYIVAAAYEDKKVTAAEQREIQNIASLLGFGRLSPEQIQQLLPIAATNANVKASRPAHLGLENKTVCFTGECQCTMSGKPITRAIAEQLASAGGFTACASVTKKLGVLVVSDPNSQSGKAKKAHQYSVRVMHEPIFWRALGIAID